MLSPGSGMRMNHWEWERMELKKTVPLISAPRAQTRTRHAIDLRRCHILLLALRQSVYENSMDV